MKKVSLGSIFIFSLLCVTMALPAFSEADLGNTGGQTEQTAGNTVKMDSPADATSSSIRIEESVSERQPIRVEALTPGTKKELNDFTLYTIGMKTLWTYDDGSTVIQESVSLDDYVEYVPSVNEKGIIYTEIFSGIEDYYPGLTADSVMSALSDSEFIAETEMGDESAWQIQDSFRELESSADFDLTLNMDAETETEAEDLIFSTLKELDVPYISLLTDSLPEGTEEDFGIFVPVEENIPTDNPGENYVIKYSKEPGTTEIKTSFEIHYSPDYQSITTDTEAGEQFTTTITPESFNGEEEIIVPLEIDIDTEEIISLNVPEGVEFVDTYDSGSYLKYTIDSEGNQNFTEMGYVKGATIEEYGVTFTFDEGVKTAKLEIDPVTGEITEVVFDKEVTLTRSSAGPNGIFTVNGDFYVEEETSVEAGEELDLSLFL